MKKRILFVDDDPILARAYATVVQNQSDRWEVRSATSGNQALELAGRIPFDVIVADHRMPGMTGAQLIAEVRQRHPQTSRVILSGLRDQEEVARWLGTTHQFIAKPVNLETLSGTLARICSLDEFLMDETLRALVGSLQVLPSFPALYVEVMNELSSPDSSIERIAGIVAQDPGMTAKMLQLVNSAVFGLPRKISSPFEAVQFLGTGTVRSLVLSVHVFSCFDRAVPGFSMDHFWTHALRCATLARAVCQSAETSPAVAEDAYIAGMLHDIGKLMLATNRPEEYQAAVRLAADRDVPLHEVEPEIFRATHSGVGAYLLGLWGLPVTIVEAVAFHHTPAASNEKVFGALAAVHAANALEHEFFPAASPRKTSLLDVAFLERMDMAQRVDNWRAEAASLRAAREN